MAEDEGLGNGISKGSDSDLESSAVGYKARRVQSGGIVCERNWLSWRRKKRKIRTRPIKNEIKFARRYLRVVAHERQFRVDLTGKQKTCAPVGPCRQ